MRVFTEQLKWDSQMNKLRSIALIFSSLFLFSCSTTSDTDAVPLRYSEPRFQNQAPIELNVEKVEIVSEFIPSFTRPNVEHLFPVSIEKEISYGCTGQRSKNH